MLKKCLFASLCLFATALQADHHKTKTPIKHLIVIFQENRSFDNYFGTYPHAENKKGEPHFSFIQKTPTINGLNRALRNINQNQAQPFRLSPTEVNTSNPGHDYTVLQQAIDSGLMDHFVQTTGAVCT